MDGQIRSFSYMRALACIAIVLLHTVFSSVGLYGTTMSIGQTTFYHVIINNLMWAVPLFIMVTGALLLNCRRKISYRKLWGKYILRILLAVIVFGLIFSLCDTLTGTQGSVSIMTFLTQAAEIFTGTSWSHLWYLYCLIGLYLLLPAYKKIAEYSREKDLIYLLGVYLLFLSVIPILQIWNIECGFYIHVSTIYPFYFFCGHLLWNYRKKYISKGLLWKAGLLFVVCTGLLVLLSVVRWSEGMDTLENLFSYSSILVVGQAVSLYALLMQLREAGVFGRLLVVIDKYSFGIYLIHMIYLRGLLKELHFNPITHGGIWCMCGMVILLTALSWMTAWLLQKIPVFKEIL